MKKRVIIVAIAILLLGLMYWVKPKQPVAPTESPVATKTNKIAIPAKAVVTTLRKPKPPPGVASNVIHSAKLKPPPRPLPEVLQSLPGYLRPLVEQPARYPSPELRAKLTTKDQAILVELYQATTNILEKEAMTMALGLIGDEEVVALFKNALIQEYAGKTLTAGSPYETDEESTLANTVASLGFLAGKYDSAYDFIKRGTDPWFWKDQVQWTSNRGNDTAGILTSYSIQAISRSGRPDVLQVLEQLKTKDMVNRVDESPDARNFSGAVIDSVISCEMVQTYGMETFLTGNIENFRRFRQQWRETENGKNWMAWYQTAKQQK